MPAISVGSVEVDIVPNARGIDSRLRAALVPPASQIGDEVGRIIGRQIAAHITPAIRDGINNGARAARPAAARQGDETAGAFSRALKARLEAAFRSLPKADVSLSTTGFDADMARLRARLETLSGKRIGIDVDAGAALAEITDIEARLRRLGAEHPNVQVRADTAAALAQLSALRAVVSAVDGTSVDINTQSAVGGFSSLTTAALAFGPAILPVLPIIAAGLGAVAAAATAAGAGLGAVALVAIPAFKGIGSALQAQKAAQQAATNATFAGGKASSQGASKALQLAGAQQALATAERNGARQIAQAQQQVRQAKQAAADAIAQAAVRNQQAARQVQDAERSLADAQVAAKQAQLDLTAARKQAAQELEDLNNQLTDSVLSQRDAEIQLQEATAQRDAVLKNLNSTELQKQKALLAYDEAVQRLKEQTVETGRLKTETAAANKAGVKGSQTYKSAQDKVAQAQRAVADQARAVKDAQAEAARTQVETARQVAEAQQRVSEATANVAVAQQNAADSVASAQRQIASASQSAAGGVDQAAVAQSKYQAELAKLTPSARGTFNAFVDLRSAFSAWSKSLQPTVMPIFTRALVALRNTLPTLTPFVLAAAAAIKSLQDRASRQLKTPFWRGFKQDLQANVKPAIVGLGVAFGNVIKGMAGIVDAFLPHMDGISKRMQTITGRFAAWGAGLKGSPAFERFLSYTSEQAPIVGHMLGQLFAALLKLGLALAPMAGTATSFILAITGVINAVPVEVLTVIGVAFASIAIGSKLAALALGVWKVAVQVAAVVTNIFTGEQWALNTAMEANPIGFIVTLIAALIVAMIYAYQRVGWFRAGVQAAWAGIKTAVSFAWNGILKPAFDGMMLGLRTVGRWAMWLWTTAIRPAFNAISLAARILITAIVVILITPLVLAFKLVAAIATWLWKLAIRPAFQGIAWVATWLWAHAIKPAFDGIAWLAHWLYNNAIKPVGRAIGLSLHAMGDVGKWLWQKALGPAFHGIADVSHWLYDKAVKPVFHAIGTVISFVWEKGIRPVFNALKTAVGLVGDAFKSAKDAIKTAWDKLKAIAKAPVQFIVDTVYNNGIVGVWNKVASAFGAPKLKKFAFAAGGVLPGYTPGRDVHRFVSPTGGMLELSGGEAVMRPEFTRVVGPAGVNSLNAAARSGGVAGVRSALGMKDGGIFGWVGSAANKVAGAGSAAWDKVKAGASWLGDTLEASARAGVKKVVDPLLAKFPGMNTALGKMFRHIPDKILDTLFGYSKKADDKGGSDGGGSIGGSIPKGKRLRIISQALAAAHVPPPGALAQWQAGLNTLITRESGWNPRAINRWDSNAKAGHPSQGLAQTIPGTWSHYVPKSLRSRGILDPVANVAAAIRYIVAVYGNITKVAQANANHTPQGYDSGGYLQPGLNLAYNGTGRPEPVFTTAQASALTSLAAAGGGGGEFTGSLYLDSGEFLGKVRGEVQAGVDAGFTQVRRSLAKR